MNINWKLKRALIERFGSQINAARELGLRESQRSYIVRGHTEPTEKDLRALEHALGSNVVAKSFGTNGLSPEGAAIPVTDNKKG